MISIAIGSAIAISLGAAPVSYSADQPTGVADPFAMKTLEEGYMIAYADRVDASNYAPGAKSAEGKCGMSAADANKDGKVTKEEFIKHHEAIFDKIDANKDGVVDKAEADNFAGAKSSKGSHGQMKK
ncbi:MAG: hypothetical protein H0X43_05990 [Nitrosospira sp.]|nr:hypothetical protein [Nitrosospira sp.]